MQHMFSYEVKTIFSNNFIFILYVKDAIYLNFLTLCHIKFLLI
jgi:hypothetical protein